jgi:hypothetical protein
MASPQALTFPLARSTETVSVQPVRAPASPPAPRALAAVAKPQATLRRPLAEADPAAAAAPAAESATGADASAAVAELVPPKPAPPANDERPGPNFDCAAPGSLAEEMVCQDTRLIAADRALGHALRRAQAGRGAGGRVAAAT